MNFKALIPFVAVIGSSTAAMARPATISASAEASFSVGYSNRGGVTVHDMRNHTARPPVQAPRSSNANGFWYQLNGRWTWRPAAEPVVYQPVVYQPRPAPATMIADGLNYGDTQFRMDILPDQLEGAFRKLQIANVTGSTFIMKVTVEFVGGGYQVIDVNKTLGRGQMITLDLEGNAPRELNRVFIYRGDGSINARHRGEFEVLGL